ncbi:hemolymph lipopolysaccharide-binding protein-like isoform X2 [Formica exsecta]|uniref:hemolymph lipopolysaccharide-binding protein-like isoform X2 n=1 Tax=Formica exsecta TaxID=72781 RepID=UPI00114232F3|nr:hemolymph lipopolysaccharide-binding protein-like isoform X2 [Formica exsecta]
MKRRMPICEIVDTSTGSGKLLPGLNRNLTPAQQIIYIYGPNQWKTQNNVDLIEKAGNDYLITPGIAAHKLHIRKLTWNKARKACIQEGENKASEAWLGIHEFYEEGGWNTIMDESLEATGYSKWTKMYREDVKVPDDNDGSQHCGSLVVNGGLDNRDCNDVYAFFCEITF